MRNGAARNAIKEDPRGGGGEQSGDPIPKASGETPPLQEVENELPTYGVKSLTDIELEEECRSLRLVEPCSKVLDIQKIVMDASFLDKGALRHGD
jgi:hypothetical protein